MNLLQKRIQRIKQALKQDEHDRAASLLISTVASDDMFRYWSECCQGSERVPKILKFIRHISFDPNLTTAVINFNKGDLCIGSGFFLNYIDGPEDLLFILIHERNHLILRKLYPDVMPGVNYPMHLFNFGEDAYINAIARRHVPSTLPERYYKKPVELLLTARHSDIDWDYFNYYENGFNCLEDAHGAIYKDSDALLKILKEQVFIPIQGAGYKHWMSLVNNWHRHMMSKPQKVNKPETGADHESPETGDIQEDNGNENQGGPEIENEAGNGSSAESPEDSDQDNGHEAQDGSGHEDEDQDDVFQGDKDGQGHDEDVEQEDANHKTQDGQGHEEDGQEVSGSDEGVSRSLKDDDSDDSPDNPVLDHEETEREEIDQKLQDEAGQDQPDTDPDTDIEQALKGIVPLVQTEDKSESSCNTQAEAAKDGKGLLRVPLPDLKPNDPVVQMILTTCDLPEFRNKVNIFEGDVMAHVDGLIRGILSDRATERSFEGYCMTVPMAVTRRDVFSLSAGEIPVMWQRRVGVERPFIDLYVDVSGSMGQYYSYIPFIYEALKHVTGRIFQFSTKIIEVDYRDRHLITTGGTSYHKVADHMIEHQVACAILFSDGLGSLSDDHIKTLKRQLEHFVYIKVKGNDYFNWEHVATEVINLQKRRLKNV